jgi:RND superfamily putative drug exporter
MERWTRTVLRFRWPVVVFWACVLLAGGYANSHLSSLLSNTFTVPGTDSERVRTILQRHFGDRSDGSYTVVFEVRGSATPALVARLQRRVDEAAHVVPTGRGTGLRVGSPHVVYGDVVSTLKLAKAKGYTDKLLRAVGHPAGTSATYVTGAAAIQHDLDPIFNQDLKRGELAIAVPIALLILVAVLGISWAILMPFAFAGATIMGTLGLVYVYAHYVTTATYVTNLVQLIGLGIAIDYSLLVVYRFREEVVKEGSVEDAVVRTMRTAGRAVIFSGATVAIGLAMLIFMPLPFMRSMGVGGFLIPLVSIAAAATLQPALLSLFGRRGTRRVRLWRRGEEPVDVEHGWWARLATAIMRRPAAFFAGGVAVLVAAAVPVFALHLTPGSADGIPRHPQAVHGFDVLRAAVGPGAISPTQILVDTGRPGGVRSPAVLRAIGQLVRRLDADPEVVAAFFRPGGRFVDATGRYAQVIVPGRHEYGQAPTQSFVHRLRTHIVPSVRFPDGVRVLAGGGPPQGVDFLARAYSYFPWLVLAVLVLTYLLLMRVFRSLLLPLKAVILNLLSVGASYGMLVVFFKWGVGDSLFGLYQYPQVEGWIPIFLFAMLFGLSMDYEVFLVTRMRETWDELHDNTRAVGYGLERTGRIITAAAVVMVAAFSGFISGRILGLQEFGLGLAVAIFVDATIVRAILVPSLMAIMGRYNWWLPARVARAVRVRPSPLEPRPALTGVATRT